jgi:hypothetical protein
MKVVTILLSVGLLGWLGTSIAQPPSPSDESAFTIDLDAANQHSYFVKCKNGRDISNCQSPSIWENTNGLRGLQTYTTPTDVGAIARDSLVLP